MGGDYTTKNNFLGHQRHCTSYTSQLGVQTGHLGTWDVLLILYQFCTPSLMSKGKLKGKKNRLAKSGPVVAMKTIRKKKQKKQVRPLRNVNLAQINRYASHLYNPFSSELAQGMFGDSMTGIQRFKSTISMGQASGTAGFVIWCPLYTARGALSATPIDNAFPTALWAVKVTSSGNIITNDINTPFGSADVTILQGSAINQVASIDVPGVEFLDTIASRTRFVSAGMALRYTGKALDTSGEFIKLDNIAVDTLLQNFTIDELFASSEHSPRPFTAGLVSRALYIADDKNIGRKMDVRQGNALAVGTNEEVSTAIMTGEATYKYSVTGKDAQNFQPACFGFAWRGVDPACMSGIALDFVRALEWEARSDQGLTVPSSAKTGPNLAPHAHLVASVKKVGLDALEAGASALMMTASNQVAKYGTRLITQGLGALAM